MKLIFAVSIACLFNLSGAILTKYLALAPVFSITFYIIASCLLFTLLARLIFWAQAGKKWQLSFIYPFLSVTYILAIPIGIILFSERPSFTKIIGGIIICTGVAVLSTTQHRNETNND